MHPGPVRSQAPRSPETARDTIQPGHLSRVTTAIDRGGGTTWGKVVTTFYEKLFEVSALTVAARRGSGGKGGTSDTWRRGAGFVARWDDFQRYGVLTPYM